MGCTLSITCDISLTRGHRGAGVDRDKEIGVNHDSEAAVDSTEKVALDVIRGAIEDSQCTSRPPKPHEYLPLAGPDHIRLAMLQPGAFDDDLVIVLNHTHFKDAVFLNYEALSYVWGSDSDQSHVQISNQPVEAGHDEYRHHSITRNLDVALRHLRFPATPRCLWIDAICINQTDKVEKSMQVRKMGDLYRCAGRVLAWLGPGTPNSEIAMNWMEERAAQVVVDWGALLVSDINGADVITISREVTRGLLDVLRYPWFHRVWIRQEIYLADQEEAIVICGHSMVPWLAFRESLASLYCQRKLIGESTDTLLAAEDSRSLAKQLVEANDALYSFIFQSMPLDFLQLRDSLRRAQCTDNRDRIFAMLSMLCPEWVDIAGQPDYTSNASQIFQDIATRYFISRKDHNLLAQCILEENASEGMPSWVPDWSHSVPTFGFSGNIKASACLNKQCSFLNSPKSGPRSIMRIHGVPGPKIIELGAEAPGDSTLDLTQIIEMLLPASCFDDLDAAIERYAAALCGGNFNEYCWPPHPGSASRLVAVSILRGWLQPSNKADIEADRQAFTEEEEASFTRKVRSALTGRRLALGLDEQIMLVPASARLGDRLCTLLGCDLPMLLRPGLSNNTHEDVQHQVIGPCFMAGWTCGEALLGPLPAHIRPVNATELGREAWLDSSTDEIIGTMDPRLEQLFEKMPQGLAEDFKHLQQDSPTAVITFGNDIHILQQHRLEVSAPGNPLQIFHLI